MNSRTQRILVALALLLVVGTPGYPEQKTADKKEAAQAKPGLEELFKNLDTNKDGHLTLGEFKATTKQPKKTAKVETTFKLGDKNDDGKLSFAEFGKMPVDGLATTPDNKGKGKATSGSFKDFLRRIPIIQITERVEVTLTEGKMALDTKTVPPCNRVVFHVKNTGEEQHHFVVAVTEFPPDKMPVKDGRVRYYTYFDEPHRLTFRDGGGWSERSARGHEPHWGPHRKEPGVKIAPGEEVEFKETHMYDPRFKPGTSFVLFCNEPGHYERGEYARVVVK